VAFVGLVFVGACDSQNAEEAALMKSGEPSLIIALKLKSNKGGRRFVAYDYLIKHGAPILIRNYIKFEVPRGMSDEESDRKWAELEQKAKERDAALGFLSVDEIAKRYIEWLNSRDKETYEKLIKGFEGYYASTRS
jgi:hypothetical protein